MSRVFDELLDDLRACHEYYCKYNCKLLFQSQVTSSRHTPRCERLQVEHGLRPQPDSATQDVNSSMDAKA